jgi:transcriptional regulator with XRE-family HTH domain
MPSFGAHLRRRREALRLEDPRFSLRRVALRIGVEPSFLSKVERDLEPPPSEPKIRRLAIELGEDPDALLARAGKVAQDLVRIICDRPELFSQLIRQLEKLPDAAVSRLMRAADSPGNE